LAEFKLSNQSTSIDFSVPCEWYVDDVLQAETACDTLELALMMPKFYEIALVSTDLNGCVDTTSYADLLEVHPQPEMAFLFNPASVTMDNPEFQFIDDSDSPIVHYEWNFANYGSSTEPYTKFNFSEVTEPGNYDVTLTGWDANQCSTIVTRQVIIEEGFVVFMPTSFTPDNDNLNEALRPVISGADRIKFYNFVVFDRWGNIVFETNDYKQWWNGDSQALSGYYVPNGSYQWRMEVLLEGLEDRKVYKGSVTIMR
jgi:gliding motility-associated-like protein